MISSRFSSGFAFVWFVAFSFALTIINKDWSLQSAEGLLGVFNKINKGK